MAEKKYFGIAGCFSRAVIIHPVNGKQVNRSYQQIPAYQRCPRRIKDRKGFDIIPRIAFHIGKILEPGYNNSANSYEKSKYF